MRRPEIAIAVAALAVTALPLLVAHPPHGAAQVTGATLSVLGALALVGWRTCPLVVLVAGPPLLLSPIFLGPDPGNYAFLAVMAYVALAAERFGGRAAVVAGVVLVGYLSVIWVVAVPDVAALLVLTVPGYLAGTAVRLRRETAEELAERGRELEVESALFAEVSVRNERARIASELHDIVGHAVSLMVIQAAAGQRLAPRSLDRAQASLTAIASAARQGRDDLRRLADLLGGSAVESPGLSRIDAVVEQAARTGLQVTCRFEGVRDEVGVETAGVAFRVVQEGLTNALRHAPGSAVRVLVSGSAPDAQLVVRVDNDHPRTQDDPGLAGSGRGLRGLRERVQAGGGSFSAGPCADGWRVEARLSPGARAPGPARTPGR